MDNATKEEIEALESALKAGESAKAEVEGSALAVEDISNLVFPHLMGSVKEALESRKVMHTNDHDYAVRYFGVQAPLIEGTAAGERLAKIVNKVCRTYQVVGTLGTPIKYDLAWGVKADNSDNLYFHGDQPMSLYLFYIAFTHEAAQAIDKAGIKANFQEGGMPEDELPEEDYQLGHVSPFFDEKAED